MSIDNLEAKMLKVVQADGRHPGCLEFGCRVGGKKCPVLWCEMVYQKIRISESPSDRQ